MPLTRARPGGDIGGRISVSASGEPFARTTVRAAMPGRRSPTIRPDFVSYRWGEDGLAGFSDDRQQLCLALALWNGHDPILKERLFGLTNAEGNHGEDVKECYYYVDATPTASYSKMLYKYPQAAFPYQDLISSQSGAGSFRPGVRASRHRHLRRQPVLRCGRGVREGRTGGSPDAGHGAQPRSR